MKCALVFLYKFPNYIIHNEELYGEPNGPLICFSVYIHQVRCAKHGIFLNGSTLCKVCEENYDINNDLIKRPEYGKKKHLTKISCYIVEFHMVHYQSMLKKYAYHRVLIFLPGKHECKKLRR